MWKLDAFSSQVTSDVRSSVPENPKVREAFLVTGAENQTFANITLIFNKRFAFDLGPQKEEERRNSSWVPFPRVKLPSKQLSHRRSSRLSWGHRAEQMEILVNLLREPGCGGGLIAGGFNALRPDDHALVD
ncbi:hypothetical protein K438DRAFT_1986553 [Mycena galopus ATCC 62051]|nr:hypothetical protein K438DRAFT_1986553 [Mycena galopus ATCC 62051]